MRRLSRYPRRDNSPSASGPKIQFTIPNEAGVCAPRYLSAEPIYPIVRTRFFWVVG